MRALLTLTGVYTLLAGLFIPVAIEGSFFFLLHAGVSFLFYQDSVRRLIIKQQTPYRKLLLAEAIDHTLGF